MHPARNGDSVQSGLVADHNGATRPLPAVQFVYTDTGAIIVQQGPHVVILSAAQFAELEAFYEEAKKWL